LRFYRKARKISPVEATGEAVSDDKIDLPQGTLELLVLKTLALGPQHGWAISERIKQMSRDALQVQQGSLYPALHRMERQGWIVASWGSTENNRQAKYYELSKAGRKRLETTTQEWRRLTAAVELVLKGA
jgi:transcriptional regulator